MEITELPNIKTPTLVTIGTFDGVHLGHISVFNQIKNIREKFYRKSKILALTFTKSPKQIINPEYTVEPSMATFTMVKVLKAQQHYSEALIVLEKLQHNDQNKDQFATEKNSLIKLISETKN